MIIPDGYHDLPPGKIASVVTYLEMTAPPDRPAVPPPPGMSLRKVDHPDPSWYRNLFRAVGDPWLSLGRALMAEDQLAAIIQHPNAHIYALDHDERQVGPPEPSRREPPDIELSFFGLTPSAIGRGAGRFLIQQPIEF